MSVFRYTAAGKSELFPDPNRKFRVLFVFLGWASIQLGFHIDFQMGNIELHLPFCFIRIGYESRCYQPAGDDGLETVRWVQEQKKEAVEEAFRRQRFTVGVIEDNRNDVIAQMFPDPE